MAVQTTDSLTQGRRVGGQTGQIGDEKKTVPLFIRPAACSSSSCSRFCWSAAAAVRQKRLVVLMFLANKWRCCCASSVGWVPSVLCSMSFAAAPRLSNEDAQKNRRWGASPSQPRLKKKSKNNGYCVSASKNEQAGITVSGGGGERAVGVGVVVDAGAETTTGWDDDGDVERDRQQTQDDRLPQGRQRERRRGAHKQNRVCMGRRSGREGRSAGSQGDTNGGQGLE